MKSVQVIVEGRVQGVAYRAWARRAARDLNLAGWVRNRTGGAVEAVFSGDDNAVDSMIELCRLGSPAAHVTKVSVEPFTGTPPRAFQVLASQ